MKYLEVTEFDPVVGAEFSILRYPHNGVFYNPRSRDLVVVGQPKGGAATLAVAYEHPHFVATALISSFAGYPAQP